LLNTEGVIFQSQYSILNTQTQTQYSLQYVNQKKMDEEIELQIMGLQPSQTQTQNYAIVLGEKEGDMRLPIIIGAFEAQAIAVFIEQRYPMHL
jgi:Domain of unknown function (DUF151)